MKLEEAMEKYVTIDQLPRNYPRNLKLLFSLSFHKRTAAPEEESLPGRY